MRLPPELRCPEHESELEAAPMIESEESTLRCPFGCRFPVVAGIPRFVAGERYAAAFGLQWRAFPRTQLDSFTETTISRDRLARCLGGLEGVRGASVLEAGCGAGRFTEVLLSAGARVFAFDLSRAAEINRANCGTSEAHFVCQADALRVPAASGAFDLVLALGMLQHTPSPEETVRALAGFVRPGGLLVLDHYARPESWLVRALLPVAPRNLLRSVLLRLPPEKSLRWAGAVTRCLLPLHRALWRPGSTTARLRRAWRLVSPVLDYYDRLPQLGPERLAEWSFLDSHDALTDRYKHLRTPDQMRRCLESCGLVGIDVWKGGNGIEARARRPPGGAVP